MRILVADRDAQLTTKMEAALDRWGHEVRTLADGNAAWAALRDADAFEVAILGADLPGMDGVELCRSLAAEVRAKPLHTIVVFGPRGNQEDFSAAIRAGADDGLWRPVDARELHGRLLMASRHLRVQSTIASLEDSVRVQSTNDALTGVWNHGAIVEMATRELGRAAREGTPTSIVLADVDRFKQVNEAHGHEAGDVVLREVARRMRASVRVYDGLGRYGNDVLMLVLPRCDETDASRLAERIRASIAETPIHTGLARVPVTLSLGVAAAAPGGEIEPRALVAAADAALARAKQSGRDRVEIESV